MDEQASDNLINNLLEDLKSADTQRRRTAANTIKAQKIDGPRLVSALREIAAGDLSYLTRRAAEEALTTLGHPPPPRQVVEPVNADNKTRDFMDPGTFNVKNVMKCCVEFLLPDGRMIPFCAYNSAGYREQVTSLLNLQTRPG